MGGGVARQMASRSLVASPGPGLGLPAYASSRAARVAWGASHRFPTKPSRLSSPSRQRRRSFGGETRALHRMMLRVRCFEHAAGEEKIGGGNLNKS